MNIQVIIVMVLALKVMHVECECICICAQSCVNCAKYIGQSTHCKVIIYFLVECNNDTVANIIICSVDDDMCIKINIK